MKQKIIRKTTITFSDEESKEIFTAISELLSQEDDPAYFQETDFPALGEFMARIEI